MQRPHFFKPFEEGWPYFKEYCGKIQFNIELNQNAQIFQLKLFYNNKVIKVGKTKMDIDPFRLMNNSLS